LEELKHKGFGRESVPVLQRFRDGQSRRHWALSSPISKPGPDGVAMNVQVKQADKLPDDCERSFWLKRIWISPPLKMSHYSPRRVSEVLA